MAQVNQSTLKALDVLEILAAAEDGLRLTDVAQQADYPLSTAHRLVLSLLERGYVEQDPASGRYYLGAKILTLQAQGIRHRHLIRRSLPYLVGLRQELNEAINLGVLAERSIVYLETLVPDSSLSFYAPPGTRMPLHCTAMGKLFLALLPEAERRAFLAAIELRSFTPRTVTFLPSLQAELDDIATRGYAVDNEEYAGGVRCCAAPIHDHTGRVVAAVSMTALVDRFPPERTIRVAAVLTRVCLEISRSLGYHAGTP